MGQGLLLDDTEAIGTWEHSVHSTVSSKRDKSLLGREWTDRS